MAREEEKRGKRFSAQWPIHPTPLHLHQEKGRAWEYRRHMARAETFLDEIAENAAPFTEQTEKLKLEATKFIL